MHQDKPTQSELAAIQRAAEGVRKWHNEHYGFIPCGQSFNELMTELSK